MPLNASDFGGGAPPKAWISGTTYAIGNVVLDTTDFCYYVRKTAGAGATAPSSDTTNWQNTNGIKSIQRGTVNVTGTTSGTVTISSVNTAKSELRFLGYETNQIDNQYAPRISLTNSTTITIVRAQSASYTTASWELTERF